MLRSGFENHDLLIDALSARDSSAALKAITDDMGVGCSHMMAGLLRNSKLSIDVLKELSSVAKRPVA